MKTLFRVSISFLVFVMVACGPEGEENIVNDALKLHNRPLLTQKEYRASYGASELFKYEYRDSLLVRSFFIKDGENSSEKVYEYDENSISIFGNNHGEKGSDYLLRYEFNAHGVLVRSITKWCCEFTQSFIQDFQYDDGKLSQSTSDAWDGSGKMNLEFELDDNGNIASISFGNGWVQQFTFDDKQNPYYKMPSIDYSFLSIFNKNNIVQTRNVSNGEVKSVVNFEYEYNAEGYPVLEISGQDTTFYEY